MAMKRCPDCGEKYSDTYKYCPFCEEEEVLRKGKDRGGRRARQSRHFSVLTPILVVLILIMAGILLFLLRDDKSPTGPKDPVTPQPGVVTPVQPDDSTEKNPSEPGETEEPEDNTDPGVMPDEPDTTTPITPTTPTTPGTMTGSTATVVNAATGVNVRPDPSTSGTPIASLKNGDEVKVVKDAGNGWYEITFSGPGGADVTVSDPAQERRIRLIFRSAKTTSIPLVARLATEENIAANVISASTQKLSEEIYGSMLLGVPAAQFDRAWEFLSGIENLQVEEASVGVQ